MNDCLIGPDGFVIGEWTTLDFTAYRGSLQGHQRSQGCAVMIASYRNGKYAVIDQNGFRFRARIGELGTPNSVRAARAARRQA